MGTTTPNPAAANANATKLADLTSKHGRLAHVEVEGKLFAFRTPTLDEWEDYQDALQKKRRGVCFRELAQVTLVHPSIEDLQALFNTMPALPTSIADALADLAGLDVEVTAKKG